MHFFFPSSWLSPAFSFFVISPSLLAPDKVEQAITFPPCSTIIFIHLSRLSPSPSLLQSLFFSSDYHLPSSPSLANLLFGFTSITASPLHLLLFFLIFSSGCLPWFSKAIAIVTAVEAWSWAAAAAISLFQSSPVPANFLQQRHSSPFGSGQQGFRWLSSASSTDCSISSVTAEPLFITIFFLALLGCHLHQQPPSSSCRSAPYLLLIANSSLLSLFAAVTVVFIGGCCCGEVIGEGAQPLSSGKLGFR